MSTTFHCLGHIFEVRNHIGWQVIRVVRFFACGGKKKMKKKKKKDTMSMPIKNNSTNLDTMHTTTNTLLTLVLQIGLSCFIVDLVATDSWKTFV